MRSSLYRLYRRIRFGKPIIVVSGLPRSGTSLAMKMLEAGGLPVVTDGVRIADEDNPNGYYEDERVKQLHEDVDKAWLRDAKGKGLKIISYLLKRLPSDRNYKVIFLRRNPQEILKSQAKMLARRGEVSETSDERMLELMKKDLDDARFFLKRPHFEVLDLPYREALEHPRDLAKRIAEFLAEPLDVEKMASVVDVKLYRNQA